MLDRPYLGQKTFDVLRVIQWLKTQGHEEIHLVGSAASNLRCGVERRSQASDGQTLPAFLR